MKQGNLIIYDKETSYACSLMEYLNQKQDFLLEARVFTNLISLKDYLEENRAEVLLVGEEIDIEEIPKEQITHIMILTEHSMVRESGEYSYLYKFQSMENLVKELGTCYADPEIYVIPATAKTGKDKRLIGVFSPFGGCGKTLFSLALGQVLSEEPRNSGEKTGSRSNGFWGESKLSDSNRKVLYIGMEAVSSFEEENNIRGNLSDILYWIRERKEGSLMGISLMTEKRGGLDCIFSPDCHEDLNSLTEGDVEFLLCELYKNQFYETIIFDIGCWNLGTFSLMEQMDHIYMPDFLNRTFLKKETSLLNSMRLMRKDMIYQKIEKVALPFDEAIYQGNYSMDRLEKTEMGRYVCRLIRKDFP